MSHHYHEDQHKGHHDPEPTVPIWVGHVCEALRLILMMLRRMEMTLDELQAKADATLAKVTEDTALNTSVATIVTDQRQTIIDLKAQLAAAGTDPVKLAALGDTIDHILSLDTSNAKIVSDAVAANVPADSGGGTPAPKTDT